LGFWTTTWNAWPAKGLGWFFGWSYFAWPTQNLNFTGWPGR
jgi:hypothetical protein